jgi:hypothetical protein
MDVAASQLDGNYVRDEVADRSSFFFIFLKEKVVPGLNFRHGLDFFLSFRWIHTYSNASLLHDADPDQSFLRLKLEREKFVLRRRKRL